PAAVIVSIVPETAHSPEAVNVTGLPEAPPVAESVSGESPYVWSPIGANEIDCDAPTTVYVTVMLLEWNELSSPPAVNVNVPGRDVSSRKPFGRLPRQAAIPLPPGSAHDQSTTTCWPT